MKTRTALSTPSLSEKINIYRTALITQMALLEGTSILNIVLYFITKNDLHFFIALGILLFIAGYLQYKWVFPFVNFLFGSPADSSHMPLLWISTSIGLLNAPKVVAAAAIIKLMKYWWVKQKEKETMERERISTELELLKAQQKGYKFLRIF